jgi:NAD(P)H dehydrogenase (quinone)
VAKILVIYYSMYGHIEIMAKAVTEGVRSANAEVVLKRVPDTMSPDVAKQYGAKLEQEAPFATLDELPQYDAIPINAKQSELYLCEERCNAELTS